MRLKRVLITGISGTGKSTLARQLSRILDIPVTHMDTLLWDINWSERSSKDVERQLRNVLKRDQWIIEGWIEPCASERIQLADSVLYLDYSGWQALWGGIRRWWQYRGTTRPELPKGCVEDFNWEYLQVMRNRAERPTIEKVIQGLEGKVIRLQTPAQTKKFLRSLRATVGSEVS